MLTKDKEERCTGGYDRRASVHPITNNCNKPRRCGRHTLFGPLKNTPDRHGYQRAACNTYACPYCGPKRLRKVRAAIAKQAEERRLTRFVTLTLDPSKIPAGESSLTYLRDTWAKMRVSLGRRFRRSIAFISTVELQCSGRAHLHVLVDIYIPQAWLSEAWQAVGGGKIVDIRFVDVHRVAAYLSKYLTKTASSTLPSGTRRFSCSKGIVLWPKTKEPSLWAFSPFSIDAVRTLARVVTDERFETAENGAPILVFFAGPPNLAPTFREWLRMWL